MELIATNPRRAAEIYLKSEPRKLTNEEVQSQLQDGTTIFQIAPAGVEAMPASWSRPACSRRSRK